jgi:hypothetical protein
MSEQQQRPKFGQDELTLSINDKRPGTGDGQKTADWHADWSGRLVLNGKTYYANLYQKNDSWIAGKLKEAPQKSNDGLDADEIPF